ncbi:MAG TPA: beta-propeller fold lactonase family protein, partial [Solirubrobacteraceae bacterium]|nr:beta-propeller fold lactonase family protein [Solirubrobacteraceae bacterium]
MRKLSIAALVLGLALTSAQAAAAQPVFSEAAGSPFSTAAGPQSIAFSPSGALIATADAGANQVSVFAAGSSGALTPVSGSPFASGGSAPGSVAFSPNGQLLAVTSFNSSTVSVFSVSSAGALTSVSGSPFTTGGAPDS